MNPFFLRRVIHTVQHAGLFRVASPELEDLANVRIPALESGVEVQAYSVCPPVEKAPVIILVHEFFGLSYSIIEKANGLSQELGCAVVCPDIFRGETSRFIPRCIWLALTTPEDRINDDLDAVVAWCGEQPGIDVDNLAVMGFCYGGGKAIRYTSARRPTAATVVCYGSPLIDDKKLRNLKGRVCGVFGRDDMQFPPSVISTFSAALKTAGVGSDAIRVYDGVGHAFWENMRQVYEKEEPVYAAWKHVTGFLRDHFDRNRRELAADRPTSFDEIPAGQDLSELFDLYEAPQPSAAEFNGQPIPLGEKKARKLVHRDGDWHSSVHVWMYTLSGELLLQKRAEGKDTFPGRWDVSVGGHVTSGYGVLETARKEVEEELGILLGSGSLLESLGVVATSTQGSSILGGDFICNEYKALFLYELIIDELPGTLANLEANGSEGGPIDIKSALMFCPNDEVSDIRLVPWRDVKRDLEAQLARDDTTELDGPMIQRPRHYIDALFSALESKFR